MSGRLEGVQMSAADGWNVSWMDELDLPGASHLVSWDALSTNESADG